MSIPLAASSIPAKKTLIVALGDSTTAGTPFFRSPLEAPPEGDGDPEGQYSYWMMHRRPQWDVRNYGINGQTSIQIRLRLDEALKVGPRYVIVLAGVNDIYQGVSVDRISENLFAMYQQIQGQGVMPIAATVLPFNGMSTAQAQALQGLNQWIKKAADKMRIPIADLNAAVRDPADPNRLNGSPDGHHPDIGGYRKMGLTLISAIDPLEKAWR